MIALSAAIVLFIIIYIGIKKYSRKKGKDFDRYASLIQFLGVAVTLLISIYTIEQSQKDSQALINKLGNIDSSSKIMSSVLDSTSYKLSQMPIQIDSFSNSIRRLNFIILKQQEDFTKNINGLNNSIFVLENSVKYYSNYIDKFNSQLQSISLLTDNQLTIWKDQQALVRDEYLRRPIFKFNFGTAIKKDSLICLDELVLSNSGNIEGKVNSIVWFIPKFDVIEFQKEDAQIINENSDFAVYQFPYQFVTNIFLVESQKLKFKIKLRIINNWESDGIIYTLAYTSQHKSGIFQDTLYFNSIKFDL